MFFGREIEWLEEVRIAFYVRMFSIISLDRNLDEFLYFLLNNKVFSIESFETPFHFSRFIDDMILHLHKEAFPVISLS